MTIAGKHNLPQTKEALLDPRVQVDFVLDYMPKNGADLTAVNPADLQSVSDKLGGIFQVTQQEATDQGARDFRDCMTRYVVGKSTGNKIKNALDSIFRRKK